MDPRDVNPATVEAELLRLSRRLEEATQQVGTWARKVAAADADYKIGYAESLLAAEGPVAQREAAALSQCEDLYREKRSAEAVLLAGQEAARNMRAQLDALRAVNVNLRALVDAT